MLMKVRKLWPIFAMVIVLILFLVVYSAHSEIKASQWEEWANADCEKVANNIHIFSKVVDGQTLYSLGNFDDDGRMHLYIETNPWDNLLTAREAWVKMVKFTRDNCQAVKREAIIRNLQGWKLVE